jgi:hypothetical protein
MFSTCVFVLEQIANVAAALASLFPQEWNTTFKSISERLSSFRREKNKERERERECVLCLSLSSIACINNRSERVRCCRPIAGKSIEEIESH